ncbi:zinc finger CCCH domain-containing protein 46 isoform X5 [Neltuma alba]|uniref:zinc finger CCCH domain-containing protein 46 isoform X5 n=1 Tax=Neltuma alba TaxID=207710 RepID=UPI0010A38DA0|nr:zinc finger CCCH domain-containing protein 46 isoform X5 [Prosopis alba]
MGCLNSMTRELAANMEKGVNFFTRCRNSKSKVPILLDLGPTPVRTKNKLPILLDLGPTPVHSNSIRPILLDLVCRTAPSQWGALAQSSNTSSSLLITNGLDLLPHPKVVLHEKLMPILNKRIINPEACKRQIVEDFEQEKPLWKLTCYGHSKGAPCDIVGDISYEELRAAAYEDAKRGMTLQSIVERERNLLNSKLVEFQNLLREPYKIPLSSSLTSDKHQSLGIDANPFSRTSLDNNPLSVSSFSQLGASMNMGIERPFAPPVDTLAQRSSFGTGGIGNLLASNVTNQTGGGIAGGQINSFPASAEVAEFPSVTTQQPFIGSNGPTTGMMFPASTGVQLVSKSKDENVSGDASIWLKEKWIPGEVIYFYGVVFLCPPPPQNQKTNTHTHKKAFVLQKAHKADKCMGHGKSEIGMGFFTSWPSQF